MKKIIERMKDEASLILAKLTVIDFNIVDNKKKLLEVAEQINLLYEDFSKLLKACKEKMSNAEI